MTGSNLSFPLHCQPDGGHHTGVIQGAVSLDASGQCSDKMPVDGIQFVIRQTREPLAAYFQGADMWMIENEFLPMKLLANKTRIEFGVMGDKNAVPDKCLKFRHYNFRFRLPGQHFPCDAVDLLGLPGDWPINMDQGAEFFHHVPAFNGYGADLDDPVTVSRRQTGCFDIEDDVADVFHAHLNRSNHWIPAKDMPE
jgi:hypothetical protein